MSEYLFSKYGVDIKTRSFILFGVMTGLYLFSVISDAMYQTTTGAATGLKVVLLMGIAVSAFFAFGKKREQTLTAKTKTTPVESFTEKSHNSLHNSSQEIENHTAPLIETKQYERTYSLETLREEMAAKGEEERAAKQKEFFNAQEGDYGKSDTFLGVNIAHVVALSEDYHAHISTSDIKELLENNVHDERIVAIWILIQKYKHANTEQQEELYDFYITNRELVNNWDLIDLAARNIIGEHLAQNPDARGITETLVRSDSVWDKRTAIMSTHPLIAEGEFDYIFQTIKSLTDVDQELVQSSIGWVLKEAHKQDPDKIESFIKENFSTLSKQAIRIGTERMDKTYRKAFLRGEF